MRRTVVAALCVATALAGAGCAGRGEATGAEGSMEEREEALLAFTECMREHGIDMPDPDTSGGGERGLRLMRPERITDADREKMDAAREECEEHLDGALQELTPEQQSEMQDNMLAFAECMREHGIDMPDPDFSDTGGPGNGGPRGGFMQRLNVDPDDPDFQEADEACREESFGSDGGPGGMLRVAPGRSG